MIFIALSILCSVAIGNLLQYFSTDKNLNIMTVFLGNYLFASFFSYLQNTPGRMTIDWFDIVFGIITGLFFLLNFIVFQKNIRVNGMSLSVGIMRVSVIIPIVISVSFFSDKITLTNGLGVIAILVAFIFIMETGSFKNFLWICLFFVVSGLTDSTMKIYTEIGHPDQSFFIFIIFTSAFVFTLLWKLVFQRQFTVRYLIYGIILGIPNQLSTRFFMAGLKSVPAPVAYPLTASSIVVLTIIFDLTLWKKRFTLKQRISMALLVLGIVFLNITY